MVGGSCTDANVVFDDVGVGVFPAILLGPEGEERGFTRSAFGVDDERRIIPFGMVVELFKIGWVRDVGAASTKRECLVTRTLFFERSWGLCIGEVSGDDLGEGGINKNSKPIRIIEELDRCTTLFDPLLILPKFLKFVVLIGIVVETFSLSAEVESSLL